MSYRQSLLEGKMVSEKLKEVKARLAEGEIDGDATRKLKL